MARNEIVLPTVLPKRALMRGIASFFDFSGSMDHELVERIRAKYNDSPRISSSEESIRSTWQAVGDSMRWAIGVYEEESDEKAQE